MKTYDVIETDKGEWWVVDADRDPQPTISGPYRHADEAYDAMASFYEEDWLHSPETEGSEA